MPRDNPQLLSASCHILYTPDRKPPDCFQPVLFPGIQSLRPVLFLPLLLQINTKSNFLQPLRIYRSNRYSSEIRPFQTAYAELRPDVHSGYPSVPAPSLHCVYTMPVFLSSEYCCPLPSGISLLRCKTHPAIRIRFLHGRHPPAVYNPPVKRNLRSFCFEAFPDKVLRLRHG